MKEAPLDTQIARLQPPVLNAQTILNKITCTRPTRHGCFNISTQIRGSKKVVNCYGHGGSGITTVFGSVNKAIRLMQTQLNVGKHIPIRVIGSGCMGLNAAIELKRQGYTISGITTKELHDIASWKAGGYFALVSVKTSAEEQHNLNEIGKETYEFYQMIDQGLHPYLSKEIVRYMPIYCSPDTDAGLDALIQRGIIAPHVEVTLDFGNGVEHPHFLKYMTYYIEVAKLMQQLTAEVERLSIPIELQAVSHFDEIQEEVIVNCSGLGGIELNGDAQLTAVRGHLILLNESAVSQAPSSHMDYMIYAKVYQEDNPEYIYLFPKTTAFQSPVCGGVLGGTFIEQADRLSHEEREALDEREFQKLLARCSQFFHGR